MDTFDSRLQIIQSDFPNLGRQSKITSPRDEAYNCIGWAAQDSKRWWWPNTDYYWPIPVGEPSEEHFIQAFQKLGYKKCRNGRLKKGYEKIVFYVDSNKSVTHAARQLSNGSWTSKLGEEYDIEHATPEGLNGAAYGRASFYMERKSEKLKS